MQDTAHTSATFIFLWILEVRLSCAMFTSTGSASIHGKFTALRWSKNVSINLKSKAFSLIITWKTWIMLRNQVYLLWRALETSYDVSIYGSWHHSDSPSAWCSPCTAGAASDCRHSQLFYCLYVIQFDDLLSRNSQRREKIKTRNKIRGSF